MKRIWLLLIAVLCLSSQDVGASALSDKIASMAPGTWAKHSPAPTNKSAINVNPQQVLGNYSDSSFWNPVRQKYYHYNEGSHGSGAVFAQYAEAQNSWAAGALAPNAGNCPGGGWHSYDGNTGDPATGDFYFAMSEDVQRCIENGGAGDQHTLYRFKDSTQTWITYDNPGQFTPGSCCTSAAFWPGLGSQGSVIVFESALTKFWRWDRATAGESGGTAGWTLFASGIGGQQSAIEYNPTENAMFIIPNGGGSNAFYKLTADGTITQLADLPVNYYDGSGFLGQLTYEPGTGKMMLIGSPSSSRAAYLYTPSSNSWAAAPSQPTTSIISTGGGIFSGAALPAHNAIVYGLCSTTTDSTSACDADLLIYKSTGQLSADQDFANRCAAPGVTTCLGFNTKGASGSGSDIICCLGNGSGQPDTNVDGFNHSNTDETISLDTTVKTSGAGSLKITAAAGRASGHVGQYSCCGDSGIPAHTQNKGLGRLFLQGGEDMYVQVRVRFSDKFFNAARDYWDSPSKIFMLYWKNYSCGANELTTNSNVHGRANIYMNCGNHDSRVLVSNPTQNVGVNRTDVYFQGGEHTCEYPNETTGCFNFPTEQWITLYYHLHTPTDWGTPTDAKLEAWYALDGGPYHKWIDIQSGMESVPVAPALGCQESLSPCPGEGFDNFALVIHSNSAAAAAPYDVWVNYDEVIVSTQPIAAPSSPGTSADATPPVVAITVPTTNPSANATLSPVTISGTASDDVGLSRVTWSNSRGGSGTALGTTNWSFSLEGGSTLLDEQFTAANGAAVSGRVAAPTNPASATWTTGGCGTEVNCSQVGLSIQNNKASATCIGCSGLRRALAYLDIGGSGNVVVTATMRPTGLSGGSLCILFRVIDVNNHDVACHESSGPGLKFYRRVGGNYTQLASGVASYVDDVDRTLTLSLNGSSISFSVNEGTPLELTDATNAGLTKFGFSFNSGTEFGSATVDNFAISTFANNLFVGSNPITVTAYDTSDNPSFDTIDINYNPMGAGDGSPVVSPFRGRGEELCGQSARIVCGNSGLFNRRPTDFWKR